MSYILDSLKRAERERRAGQVPDLGLLYEEAPNRPVKRIPGWGWVAALLLLNAIFFAGTFFYFRDRSPVGPPSKTVPSQNSPSVAMRTPGPPAQTKPLSAPEPPAPAVEPPNEIQIIPPSKAMSSLPQSVAPKSVGPTPTLEKPAEPDTDLTPSTRTSQDRDADNRRAQASTPGSVESARPDGRAFEAESFPVSTQKPKQQQTQTALNAPSTETKTLPEVPVPVDPVQVAEAAPERQSTGTGVHAGLSGRRLPGAQEPVTVSDKQSSPGDPEERVPYFRELKPELRERFSDLTLNVLVYYDDPDRSLAYINFRRYRTGEQIDGGDGLRIDRILSEGVVLDYGEGRFMLQTSR